MRRQVEQKIRFYVDEHVPRAVVRGLRQRGIDILSVSEAGLLGASDEEHLRIANAEGRVVVTQDSDFLRLHALGLPHVGIVYVPNNMSIGEMIRELMLIYQVLEVEDMLGRIEYL
jgi:predicted nuclease of predicted toxin-antitoxin system